MHVCLSTLHSPFSFLLSPHPRLVYRSELEELTAVLNAVCTVASRYYKEKPHIHGMAVHFAKAAAANAVIDGWKTVEMCQAFALWSVYNPPARRWEEDRAWCYTGIAFRSVSESPSLRVPESPSPRVWVPSMYEGAKLISWRVIQAGYRAQPEPYPRQIPRRACGAREPQPDADVADVLHHGPLSEHPVRQGVDGPGGCGECRRCRRCRCPCLRGSLVADKYTYCSAPTQTIRDAGSWLRNHKYHNQCDGYLTSLTELLIIMSRFVGTVNPAFGTSSVESVDVSFHVSLCGRRT